jgi:D-sedoheptulose 7-phosphate isomerase
MDTWPEYLGALAAGLDGMVVTGRGGACVPAADAFAQWTALTREIDGRGGSVFLVGNGASAGIASHMAADALKNARLRAFTFNDPALLTATGNDLAFDQVFALPLDRLGRDGDLLISISSSGNSPNIVCALEAARARRLHIVTLSGKGADNRSRSLGDLNFYVPSPRYGWVECAHQMIVHYWLDQYMSLHREGPL